MRKAQNCKIFFVKKLALPSESELDLATVRLQSLLTLNLLSICKVLFIKHISKTLSSSTVNYIVYKLNKAIKNVTQK